MGDKLDGSLISGFLTAISVFQNELKPEKHASKDVKSGFIIEVVQQGYAIGDRIIRPSQVRVAQ